MKANITNSLDNKIRQELDECDDLLEKVITAILGKTKYLVYKLLFDK